MGSASSSSRQTSDTTKPVDHQKGGKSDHKMEPKRQLKRRTVSIINADEEALLKIRYPELENVSTRFDNQVTKLKEINVKNERKKSALEREEYEDVLKLVKSVTDPFNEFQDHQQRAYLGKYLARIGFVAEVVNYYGKILDVYSIKAYTQEYIAEEDEEELDLCILMEIRTLLWNYADESEDFSVKIASTPMFQYLVMDLQGLLQDESEMQTLSYESIESFAFNSTMGIINNCARNTVTRDVYSVRMPDNKIVKMVDCLKPFIEKDIRYVKLVSLLALSHIVNEEENRILTADIHIFDFLIEIISKATKTQNRRQFGFSVHELVDGLAKLAKNDDNKILIMERDAYPLLKDILLKGSIIEQTTVVNALWELSFAHKNKKLFRNDKTLMAKLKRCKESDDVHLKKAADGACFVIDQEDMTAAPKNTTKAQVGRVKDGHIMISYNWGDQKTLIKVKEWLVRDGFKVWMDIENMEGSLLESMARAIENATVVLMCYSEKYKDSQNCRTEAEYTYKLKKETVPLLMQKGYQPDGWLGILVGSKLFYDFTGVKYPIESKYNELIRNLQSLGRITEEPESALIPKQTNEATSMAPKEKWTAIASSIKQPATLGLITSQWTKADIDKWLKQNKLETFSGLKNLTPEQIGFLYKLFHRAPEAFYRCIQEKLGMKSLEELMRFSDAVENLR